MLLLVSADFIASDYCWGAPPSQRCSADLFLRLRRTTDAEMAATVHFAAKELAGDRRERPSEIDVFNAQLRRADRSGREGR